MNWNLLHVACLAAALAVLSLADAVAYAGSQPDVLPTGATITPDAAPGAVFQTLTVNLPDYPDREVDGAQTTALSPDGKKLLILTSGFNKLRDANGAAARRHQSRADWCGGRRDRRIRYQPGKLEFSRYACGSHSDCGKG